MDAIVSLLEETDGDAQGCEKAIDKWIDDARGDLEKKLDNYAALIKAFEAKSKARKEEANRLLHMAKVDANAAQRMKDRLTHFFTVHDIKKMETPRYKLSMRAGKPGLLVGRDVEELDERFQKVTVAPDKKAITQAIQSGEEIAGCCMVQKVSIWIR